MGCDIHLYLEIRDKKTKHWDPISYEQLAPGRNYVMFGYLAGVRYEPENFTPVEHRGVPEDASWVTVNHYTLCVNDGYSDSDGFCTKADALRWIQDGSYYWPGDKSRVTGPDWHSASWLTKDEFAAAIYAAMLDCKDEKGFDDTWFIQYRAIQNMMEFYSNYNYDTRIVFWFDN